MTPPTSSKAETFDRARLRTELEADEARRRFAYVDCCAKSWKLCTCKEKGELTIGVGWNLDANGLPDAIVDQLLDLSIDQAAKDADELEPRWRDLIPDRQRVLLTLAFNLGLSGARRFVKFWQAIGEYLDGDSEVALDRAAGELRNSKANRQTKGRYDRLADRIATQRT